MNRLALQISMLFLVTLSGVPASLAQEPPSRELPLDTYLSLAADNDSAFEKILIDELVIRYRKELSLPPGDLLLSVKQHHEFFLAQGRNAPKTEIGLERLFPETGTAVDLSYTVESSIASSTRQSRLNLNLSQPIARNAFGRSTRLLDKIVGLEMEVARHQVTEAYEDYLALVTTAYCEWYEAWENLAIGRSSYRENLKLMDDIRKRQQQNIALPIDVNKVELQVLAKKENLLALEERLRRSHQLIRTIIRYEGDEELVPLEPPPSFTLNGSFEQAFSSFEEHSRTFSILKKLEEKSSLQVERDADDLFPSIDLVAGYELQGEDYGLEKSRDSLYAGVTLEWPLPDRVEQAEHEVSKVLAEKSRLETDNLWHRLYAQLAALYFEIEREAKLIEVSRDKIALARAILRDETENYSFGRVTLNDYIQAVNVLDANRFSKVRHESLHRRLLIEWLRLTDRLVERKAIDGPTD